MKRIFGLLLTLLPFLANAGLVTPQQAHETAARFFRSDSRLYGKPHDLPLQLVWTGQPQTMQSRAVTEEPPFYVFNRGTGQGFIIISADNAAYPVLGYSRQGTFETDRMPANFKAWMDQLADQIGLIRQLNLAPADDIRQAWIRAGKAADDEKEVTLETPLWDQSSPYNLQCPEVSGSHCYTGCTITATCIVMGYHQWPDRGVGTLPGYLTYPSTGWEVPLEIAPVELGETYDWSIMPGLNGNSIYDVRGEHTVSSLMYHVGVMSKANFSVFATDAQPYEAAAGLSRYMKYKKGIRHLMRECFTEAYWDEMMHREIDEHRPVVYDGYGKNRSEGHAFVLDGYRGKDFYSVNWGWGGRYNGFFYLSSLIPSGQGAGGTADGNFSYAQGGLFGVAPLRDGETDESFDQLMFIKYGINDPIGLKILETEIENVQTGVPFWLSAGWVCNMGNVPFKGEIKVVLTDAAGKIKETYYTRQFSELLPGNMIYSIYDRENNYTLVTITQPIEPGDRLRMLYKNDTATEWSLVYADPLQGPNEIVLKAGAPAEKINVRFKVGAEGSLNVNGKTIRNGSYELSCAADEKVSFSVQPDPGYEVEAVQVNGEPLQPAADGSYTLQVTRTTDVTVTFRQARLTLTIQGDEGGSVVYNGQYIASQPKTFEVHAGEEVTVTVTPYQGYEVESFTVNGEELSEALTDNRYTLTIGQDTEIKVGFSKARFALEISQNEGGYVLCNQQNITAGHQTFDIAFEDIVDLIVRPNPGNKIQSILFNGNEVLDSPTGQSFVFRMVEPVTLQITYSSLNTGIDEAGHHSFRAYNGQGRLVIEGAEAGQDISIYTVDGKLLFSFTAQSPTLHLDLPKGAAYIIKSRNKSFKVML